MIPATTTDPKQWEELFKLSGFNGCIRSMDATHIGMLKLQWSFNIIVIYLCCIKYFNIHLCCNVL
jgi:hypothetical protein